MVVLRQSDFLSDSMNMWGALVEDAITSGVLAPGTKCEDVDELTVKVVK